MADLEDFRNGIKACIENGNAFGVESGNETLAGVIAIDRTLNEILWLAVAQKYRGNKCGELLVKKAIEELSAGGDIFVQTFSNEVAEGLSARRLYLKNGFVDLNPAGKNPAGIETVIMVRK